MVSVPATTSRSAASTAAARAATPPRTSTPAASSSAPRVSTPRRSRLPATARWRRQSRPARAATKVPSLLASSASSAEETRAPRRSTPATRPRGTAAAAIRPRRPLQAASRHHIPTTAPCSRCHTTAGNYALYSPARTRASRPALPAACAHGGDHVRQRHDRPTPANHIPIGSLDCNGAGFATRQRERRGLQARQREHQRTDAQRGRTARSPRQWPPAPPATSRPPT